MQPKHTIKPIIMYLGSYNTSNNQDRDQRKENTKKNINYAKNR